MAINKEEGILLLKRMGLPTVDLIDYTRLTADDCVLNNGLSVRLSPQSFAPAINVYLPSIHNCHDIDEIREFVKTYTGMYHFMVHQTVKPDLIGSVTSFSSESIVIETYASFNNRAIGLIDNRVSIPIYGGRFFANHMVMLKSNEHELNIFLRILMQLKRIPFDSYDMEFVIEGKELLFTDFTIPELGCSSDVINYLLSSQSPDYLDTSS